MRTPTAVASASSSVNLSGGSSKPRHKHSQSREVSAADERSGQRNQPRAAACHLGKVDNPVGRCARLQVRVHAEFSQAHPVRLGRTLTDRAFASEPHRGKCASNVGRRRNPRHWQAHRQSAGFPHCGHYRELARTCGQCSAETRDVATTCKKPCRDRLQRRGRLRPEQLLVPQRWQSRSCARTISGRPIQTVELLGNAGAAVTAATAAPALSQRPRWRRRQRG
jgi:hypothetical protein